jgi:phospholipase/carboxylesterase
MLRGVTRLLSLTLLLALVGCDRPTPPPASQPSSPAPTPAPAEPAEPAPVAADAPTAPATRPKAGELHYVERILGNAKAEDPLPMIVAIHGLGDDPDNFAHLFDAYGGTARLILPQGVDETEDGGWSWFPIRARSNDVEALAAGIDASAAKIAAAIEELRVSRPTVGDPIVTGFSQGGMLAFTLAVKHPQQVGFAVPIGGWLPPPLWPESGPTAEHPAMVALHGTADNAVPYEPTKEAIDALVAKGYTVTLKSYEGVRHAIPPEERTDLFDLLDDALATANGKPKENAP